MTQIKFRRDSAANFASSNPVLGAGEPAWETDTKKLKIGDGSTAYNDLDYFSSGGSSTFNTVLPLKMVDDTLTLQIDEQTIQVQDGKLVANLDELGNEVNDLSGRVTAAEADILTKQDKLTAGDNITISDTNIISATAATPSNMVTTDTTQTITGTKTISGEIKISGEGQTQSLAKINTSSRIPYLYLGGGSIGMFLQSSSPVIRQNSTGTTYAPMLDTANISSYIDGSTITWDASTQKLSASGGSSSGDVTAAGDNTFTGSNTFSESITLYKAGDTASLQINADHPLIQFDDVNNVIRVGNSSNICYLQGSNQYLTGSQVSISGTLKTTGNVQMSKDLQTTGIKLTNNGANALYDRNNKVFARWNSTNTTLTLGETASSTIIGGGNPVTDKNGNTFLTSGNVTAYVTEEYINGTEGYRIWSNGRCEQWGVLSGPSNITYLKEYANTDYIIQVYVKAKTSGEAYNGVFGTSYSTTGFECSGLAGTTGDAYIISTMGTCSWYTSGQLAS